MILNVLANWASKQLNLILETIALGNLFFMSPIFILMTTFGGNLNRSMQHRH